MNGIDTNVLLRLLLRDDPEQAKAADQFMEQCASSDEACFINRIVLTETVWVLQSGYRYVRADVSMIVEQLLRTREFAIENAQEVRKALDDYRSDQADFADCLIGHTNLALGCRVTATFDKAASKLDCFATVVHAR
jgi:predicted nucleic-acid-binding protein